jgi:parallel beta-helix repeat protein
MRAAFCIIVVTLLALALPAYLSAAEGRIPISGQTVIDNPGSYIVTQDFSVDSSNGISIRASHVTVDLDGHTITGTGATPGDVIKIQGSYYDVHVRNGKIVGGDHGVMFDIPSGGGEFSVEDLTVSQSKGIRLNGASGTGNWLRCTVQRNSVTDSTDCGIALTYTNNGRIEENVISGSISSGVQLYNALNVLVRENTLTENAAGLSVSGTVNNVLIIENVVSSNTGTGIFLAAAENAVVDRNTISGNDYDGLSVSTGRKNRISNNNISGNGHAGVSLSAAIICELDHNLLQENAAEGISLNSSNFNVIEGNIAAYNNGSLPTGCGINFVSSSDNIYASNRTLNNGGASCTTCGICNATGNTDGGGNIDVP